MIGKPNQYALRGRQSGRAGLLLLAVLLAAPAMAEHESNFGRVILASSDLIVQGVASAKRTRAGELTRVEVSVTQTLHGKDPGRDIQMLVTDAGVLKKDEAVRGLFALKSMSTGGFTLVGKPVLTPDGDAEERDKLRVLRAFLDLENEPAGDERTASFWTLLMGHVREGGYPAQNAAVELMFVARDRAGIITEALFDDTVKAISGATKVLTKQTQDDLKLALQGMVEARIKSLKFRKVRREEKAANRRVAAAELVTLQEKYPRAFTDADARLCDALVEAEKDPGTQGKLEDLARSIRVVEGQRKAEEEAKAEEARKKIEHAGR